MKNNLLKLKTALIRNRRSVFFYLTPLFSFILVEILQYGDQSLCLHPFTFGTFWINLLFYFAVYMIVRALTGRPRLTMVLLHTIFLLIGICNHFSIDIRNSPILPWDLYAAGTAFSVLSNQTFKIPLEMIICIILSVVWLVFAMRTQVPKLSIRKRLSSMGISAIFLTVFTLFSMFGPNIFYTSTWKQVTASRQNGYIFNFCMDIGILFVDEPEGYSAEAADRILSSMEQPEAQPEDTPNIVVIMNETFSDMSMFGDLEKEFGLTEDVMPFVHSLEDAENCITGQLVVPAFGGGTCNSEYEALTGNSYAFFKGGSYPMLQYVQGQRESLASILKEQGYSATAMHPYYGTGWGRNRSYPRLGFDKFITLDDFPEDIQLMRRYISDRDDYDMLKKEYEAAEEPFFMFNVTMQNHCGYDTVYDNFEESVSFTYDYAYPLAKQYLSLIKESDSAIEELIEYFRQSEEPTIVVFFGDHQAYIEDSFYTELFQDSNKSEAEIELDKHTVPYFIWANYEIDEEKYSDLPERISANYLGALTLDVAGLNLSQYQQYVYGLIDEWPVISSSGCVDSNGYLYSLDDPKVTEALADYKIVQYENVFGESKKTTQTQD